MFRQIMLVIYMTVCATSCRLIPPMPEFRTVTICPPVFIPFKPEESIYKVHCRCAPYNPNTGEFLGPFIIAPIKMCDRAQGIVLEDFKAIFEPDMQELQEWESDWRDKEKEAKKLLKKTKMSKRAKKKLKKIIDE